MNIRRSTKHVVLALARSILSFLVHINHKKILFQSFPDYSDNARAFSDYVVKNTDYKVYWAVENLSAYHDTDRIKYIQLPLGKKVREKIVYIYHTLSSQILVSTHAAFLLANKKRQTYVCCWHGMPFKKIGVWRNPENTYYLDNASFVLSTSTYYIPILSKCFNKPNECILPTGYPRNDWLFTKSDVLNKLQINKKEKEKIILYLPTFRKVSGGREDSDKDAFKDGPFDFTSKEDMLTFNEFLRQHNILLFVKPHPSEQNQLNINRLSNIIIVPHKYFIDNDIQLNKLMYYADALITDFSGAFCDFLLLDRPIGFVLTDVDDYKNNRGFIFENYLDYLPGQKIISNKDFKLFCINVEAGIDEFILERKKLYPIYNDYNDGNNCQRLAEAIGISFIS